MQHGGWSNTGVRNGDYDHYQTRMQMEHARLETSVAGIDNGGASPAASAAAVAGAGRRSWRGSWTAWRRGPACLWSKPLKHCGRAWPTPCGRRTPPAGTSSTPPPPDPPPPPNAVAILAKHPEILAAQREIE